MAISVVFVHGGGHGAWCWSETSRLLAQRSVAVDLPGRGKRADFPGPATLRDLYEAVLADVDEAELDDLILVGHSLAGVTLPAVAHSLGRRVRHAVYVSAIVPGPGQSPLTAVYGALARPLGALVRIGPARVAPSKRLVCSRYFNDIPSERHDAFHAQLCSEWTRLMTEPVKITSQDVDTPSTFVRLARDKQLPPRRQAQMVARLGAECEVVTLDSGHDPMLSRPEELAAVISGIAERYQ